MFCALIRSGTFGVFGTKLSPTKHHSIYLQHPLNDPGTKSCNKALSDCRYCWQASGWSRGGARPLSPLFLDQTEARRAEKIYCDRPPPPLISGSGWSPPPPPPPPPLIWRSESATTGSARYPLVGLLYLWLHNLARNRSQQLVPHILH